MISSHVVFLLSQDSRGRAFFDSIKMREIPRADWQNRLREIQPGCVSANIELVCEDGGISPFLLSGRF